MRLVDRPVTPRVSLLLIALWVFLLVPIQCFQGRPTWRYTSSEVVIPRKQTYHGKEFQVLGRLSYSLRFRGQRHVIHLRRKRIIWPRHLLLTTQDDQGALQMDYPFFPADCYYIGYLEGIPQSMVTVDTCYGGLKGFMKLDDLAYEIKPLNDSHRFEHLISQVVADSDVTGPLNQWKPTSHTTGPPSSGTYATGAPRMSSKDYASHPAAIKGHFQASYSIKGNGTVEACAAYLFQLVNLVDNFLSRLHLRYFVFLLTVYSNSDPFSHNFKVPGGDAHNYYVANFYNRFKPGSSTFITKSGPADDQIPPVANSVCTDKGINFIGENSRWFVTLAVLLANRIGTSLGLTFDEEKYCKCHRRATCIMFRNPSLTDAFSNCSFEQINQILNVPNKMPCLFHDPHTYYNLSLTYWNCGNFIVNQGEQCDCGSYKACYADPCCKSDCRFTENSICDKESCCANCTYSPIGTLCRTMQSICDLPEYCNGQTITCPSDSYLQDGTPCSEEGYCYKGNCTDRNIHCKEIFGSNALKASATCYNINKERFRFGHCVRPIGSLTYTACSERDKMCGRLQCTNVTHLPHLPEHAAFHQSVISGSTCFGLDEHRGSEIADVGQVRVGTQCSGSQFCDRGSCNGTLSSLNYDCTPEKCHFRGICNNKRNCHCHIGWEPPTCAGAGSGGSVDSGPLIHKKPAIRQSHQPVYYLRLIVARIYAFISTLFFGLAMRIGIIKVMKIEEVVALLQKQGFGQSGHGLK